MRQDERGEAKLRGLLAGGDPVIVSCDTYARATGARTLAAHKSSREVRPWPIHACCTKTSGGEILDRPDEELLEIRWYDSTADLDGQGFNRFLAVFADFLLDKRRPRVFVDSTAFRMDPAKMDLDWRNANIIPSTTKLVSSDSLST